MDKVNMPHASGPDCAGAASGGHLLFLSAWSLNSDRRRKSSNACERWPSRSDDPLSNQDDTAQFIAAIPSWAASLARRGDTLR
jgi:hypothetical protein